jgi:hypothetical protein
VTKATATATLSGSVTDPDFGVYTVGPLTVLADDANTAVVDVVLADGDNAVGVPQLPVPTGVIVQLPRGNALPVTLKGAGGDAGIRLARTGFLLLLFDKAAPPTTLVIGSVGAQTGNTRLVFF